MLYSRGTVGMVYTEIMMQIKEMQELDRQLQRMQEQLESEGIPAKTELISLPANIDNLHKIVDNRSFWDDIGESMKRINEYREYQKKLTKVYEEKLSNK